MKFKNSKFLYTLLFLLMSINIFCNDKNDDKRVRTVITTDCELDDMNSIIRFLLYSNEFDLEGIVVTSSTFHYSGDTEKGIKPFNWDGTDKLNDIINKYGEAYPNLKVHAKNFPTPEYIKSITKIGNITLAGEMDKITEGSELLKNIFLEDDPRPLYVQTWGGTNTTARALKSIEEKYKKTPQWEDIKEKISNKLVMCIILDQDDSYKKYIANEWPEIKIIKDTSNFWHFAYPWQIHTDKVNSKLKGNWMYENIKSNNGSLLETYALMGDGTLMPGAPYEEQRGTDDYLKNHPNFSKYDFISEGDSPAFLNLIDNGLRSLENPTYGGWGGRFGIINSKLYQNTALDFDPYTNKYEAEYTLMRWFDDMQNDFAARADWTVEKKYGDANHNPNVSVKEGLDLKVKPGEKITLHATATDPDGDKISFKWWHYSEADTYMEYKGVIGDVTKLILGGMEFGASRELSPNEIIDNITLENSDSSIVKFTVPKDAKKGETIHIIVEAIDSGKYNLKHYQRVILTVK